jgi:hypothetical protein
MLQLSDGVKKWSVILPTAPLPRPWRVAARERLLARLELAKTQRANLLIIAHPKSGNTWLKVMLSRLYQARYGLPDSLINSSDELARRNPAIPRISATNGYYSYEGAVGRALGPQAPDSELRHKPVQFTKRQSARKQELINHFIAHPVDRRTISMWDFVRHSDIGLPSLIDFLNTWERNVKALERSLILRYEDLRAEPAKTLRQVIELMGESFSDEEIEEAVSFGSFDNLRQLESKGVFRQGGLTLRNPKDPDSFKVRRGKVGGYRDYFTPEQVAELEALMESRLSPGFGYTAATPAQTGRVAV